MCIGYALKTNEHGGSCQHQNNFITIFVSKSNDPDKIPNGRMENKVPNVIESIENFSRSIGVTDPRVVSEIPKRSIPRYAERNTDLVDSGLIANEY
jgi:hypothetical protein